MAWFKSNPLFASVVGLLLILAISLGALTFTLRGEVARSAEQIRQKEQTLNTLSRRAPFPSSENAALVASTLEQVAQTRELMTNELQGGSEVARRMAAAPVPATSTAAFFNLSNFVEEMTQRAQAVGVVVPAGTRFGFSAYQFEGPTGALLPRVFRQRQVSEYILNKLFEAKPASLVSLQRERPRTAAERQVAEQAGNRGPQGSEGDFFEIDRRISARVDGFIETSAYRVTFLGYTESLRSFLNSLSAFELPLVVRSVEIEPTQRQDQDRPRPQVQTAVDIFGLGGGSTEPVVSTIPLVQPVPSRIIVTIELISLVSEEPQPNS